MTQTSTYSEYGTRQDEFGYLCSESQAEIISYCHGVALMMNAARSAAVVKVCVDGFEITQAMVDAEIAATAVPRVPTLAPMTTTDPFYTGFYGIGHFA